MKAHPLKAAFDRLGANDDLVSIKSDLHTICSAFGSVRRLDVIQARQGDKRQALCFLRMHRAEHEEQVMRFLEIARFEGELIVIVDLPRNVIPGQQERNFGNRRSAVRDIGIDRRFIPVLVSS